VGSLSSPEFLEIEELYCGSVFPNKRRFFSQCQTALCIFCAEWLGMQDAYWVARAGLVGECVDTNGEKLAEMKLRYPDDWQFHTADAYEFAQEAVEDGRQWDMLTLDPWSGQFEKCADLMDTWTTLARKVVVLGHGNYRLEVPQAPSGWKLATSIKRTDFKGGVFWLVFARA